ncbi:hypothetical protein N7466_008413 [Penicillium verhagenii]|uniref:uncharacterized protein n=1 Tax=Penicillium verhagenii TaxID=1562060 RepID=UPI0025451F75|nr:uncharacterized protein N7466_008413 [Penicillium verhagenii]KAJ5924226.1 hypothetical protein N7466_008413 [Penicillium verhagenii]
MLTEILHINTTTSPQIQQVQRLIKVLPKRLLRQRVSLTGLSIRSSGLCDLHRPMNSDVLGSILSLVQREVTQCFQPFDRHPELVGPTETYMLGKLRAVRGMWTRPGVGSPTAAGAWAYQINECAACMLGRVALQKESVLLLRVALQSRTRTGRTHRPRKLMIFVDECMNRFSHGDAEEIFSISSNLAYRMKATRRACSQTHRDRAKRGPVRSTDGRRERAQLPAISGLIDGQGGYHGENRDGSAKQNPPSARELYLSANTDIEWAVPSEVRTSGGYEAPYACEGTWGNNPFLFMGEEGERDNVVDEESGDSEDECDSPYEGKFI